MNLGQRPHNFLCLFSPPPIALKVRDIWLGKILNISGFHLGSTAEEKLSALRLRMLEIVM